jgi:MFS family permease
LLSRAFAVLCLVYFLNSFLSAPFSSLFPVYIEADLARPPWFTGYLRALMLLLGGIFAVIAGRLCDRFGLKLTLIIGLAGSALTGLVFRTGDPAGLSLLLFLMGAASGPWSTAGQSMLIRAVKPTHLGLGGALYFLSNTLGNSVGSLCTGLIKTSWSFAQIGVAMSVGMLAVIALAALLLPADREPAQRSQVGDEASLWTAYRPLLVRSEIWLLLSLRLTITTFWGMATLAMPLLIYRVGASESLPAYFASVSLVVAAGCQLGTGVLNDRLGHKKPLLVAASGICLSALGMAIFRDSLTGLFVCGTALTGTAWAVSTLVPKLINDVAAPDEKNRLVGLGHMAWSASMVSGSLIGGYLIDLHPALPFAVGVLLAGGGTLGAWRLCVYLDNRSSAS